jgi:Uma2 family endonuclease
METAPRPKATIADLKRTEGRAELIDGVIVDLGFMCVGTGMVVGEIAFSLDDHAKATGLGQMFTSTIAYVVPPLTSGRESFSPSVSYTYGPWPEDKWDFLHGPPAFAAEVRDLDDDHPGADRSRAAKRLDYFEAGTFIVWDVETFAGLIHAYHRDDPDTAITYSRGQIIDAEPAVPGWRMAVDEIFAPLDVPGD